MIQRTAFSFALALVPTMLDCLAALSEVYHLWSEKYRAHRRYPSQHKHCDNTLLNTNIGFYMIYSIFIIDILLVYFMMMNDIFQSYARLWN